MGVSTTLLLPWTPLPRPGLPFHALDFLQKTWTSLRALDFLAKPWTS